MSTLEKFTTVSWGRSSFIYSDNEGTISFHITHRDSGTFTSSIICRRELTYSSGTTCHLSAINTGNTGLLNSSFFWSFWKGTQENWVIEFSMNHCGGIIGLEIWKCQVSLNTPSSLSILISQCIRLFWTKVTSIWCFSKKIIFHSAGAFFNGMPEY